MSEQSKANMHWKGPRVGHPAWIEIPAIDVQALKKFYEELFPAWEWRPAIESYPADKLALYRFGPDGSTELGGAITKTTAENKTAVQSLGSGSAVYYCVKSAEETQKKAEELGATVVQGRTEGGHHGYHVIMKDPEGNRFGVYEFI